MHVCLIIWLFSSALQNKTWHIKGKQIGSHSLIWKLLLFRKLLLFWKCTWIFQVFFLSDFPSMLARNEESGPESQMIAAQREAATNVWLDGTVGGQEGRKEAGFFPCPVLTRTNVWNLNKYVLHLTRRNWCLKKKRKNLGSVTLNFLLRLDLLSYKDAIQAPERQRNYTWGLVHSWKEIKSILQIFVITRHVRAGLL